MRYNPHGICHQTIVADIYIMADHIPVAKIRHYATNDPRYGFTIEDSHTPTIYPLHLSKYSNQSCARKHKLDTMYPEIVRCWAEGYEHCVDPRTVSRGICDANGIELYAMPENTIQWDSGARIGSRDSKAFAPRVLEPNTFYDQPHVSQIRHNELRVDTEPEHFDTMGHSVDWEIVASLLICGLVGWAVVRANQSNQYN